jgi:hypothetical protein
MAQKPKTTKKTNEPKIAKKASVLKTEISLDFTDTEGADHKATVIRDAKDPDNWEVSVDGKKLPKKNGKALKKFLFCEQDKNGDKKIGKKKYFCHEVKAASEGAFLLGNHSCPFFLNPPGIWINL